MTFQILWMSLNDVPSWFNQLAYTATKQVSTRYIKVCVNSIVLIKQNEVYNTSLFLRVPYLHVCWS